MLKRNVNITFKNNIKKKKKGDERNKDIEYLKVLPRMQ